MSKYVEMVEWDDVPHLSDEEKASLLASIPPYQRDARTKGVPQLGSGAIYPFPESGIKVPDLEVPKHWPRGFGLDAQPLWKSHVIGALDREAQILYITHVWKREQVEPVLQVQAIHALGTWIPGVGDASGLIQDADRRRYIDLYRALKLDIELAEKGVEAGIQALYDLMAAGQFKVFQSCSAWFEEFRLYRRDEMGRIVKRDDHLMDSTRYLLAGRARMKTEPAKTEPAERVVYDLGSKGLGWMR